MQINVRRKKIIIITIITNDSNNEISHEIKQVVTESLQLHQLKKSYKYNCGVVLGQWLFDCFYVCCQL